MTKIKRFKTLKEFERQIPQRLNPEGKIPLTREDIVHYYNGLLGVDVPRSNMMTFRGYQIVESVA